MSTGVAQLGPTETETETDWLASGEAELQVGQLACSCVNPASQPARARFRFLQVLSDKTTTAAAVGQIRSVERTFVSVS